MEKYFCWAHFFGCLYHSNGTKTHLHVALLIDLQFLKICEDHNVIPKFLRFEVANSNFSSSTYRRCQRKLLWEEIYNKKLVVSKLDKESILV